jgi:hypothetical protein
MCTGTGGSVAYEAPPAGEKGPDRKQRQRSLRIALVNHRELNHPDLGSFFESDLGNLPLSVTLCGQMLRADETIQTAAQLIAMVRKVDLSVIGQVDVLRNASIEMVESIGQWQKSQITYPTTIHPFMWNGDSYMDKMGSDLDFLGDWPTVVNWLGFSPVGNPFLVPPDLLDDDTDIPKNAFVIFGKRPAVKEVNRKDRSSMPKTFLKSPYDTPIINDPVLMAQAAIAEDKKRTQLEASKEKASKLTTGVRQPVDPFESYIDYHVVHQIKRCWGVLIGGGSPALLKTLGERQFDPWNDSMGMSQASVGTAGVVKAGGAGGELGGELSGTIGRTTDTGLGGRGTHTTALGQSSSIMSLTGDGFSGSMSEFRDTVEASRDMMGHENRSLRMGVLGEEAKVADISSASKVRFPPSP